MNSIRKIHFSKISLFKSKSHPFNKPYLSTAFNSLSSSTKLQRNIKFTKAFSTNNPLEDPKVEFYTFTREELVKIAEEKRKDLERLYDEKEADSTNKLIAAIITLPLVFGSFGIWLLPDLWIPKAITFSVKYLGIQLALFSGIHFGHNIVEHHISIFKLDHEPSRLKIYGSLLPIIISAILIYQMVYAKDENKIVEDDISLFLFALMYAGSYYSDSKMVGMKMAPFWIKKLKLFQITLSILSIVSLLVFKATKKESWSLAPHLKNQDDLLGYDELLKIGADAEEKPSK